MTKADLIERIQANTGFTKKESADMLATVFSGMKCSLEDGEEIKIAGFGNFEINYKKDRIGRNPTTGEALFIKARSVLTFKPSPRLKQAINQKP
jgi:integration host factor subunit alpha